MSRVLQFPVALLLCLVTVSSSATADLSATQLNAAKSILRTRCAECHSAEASVTEFDVLNAQSMVDAEAVIPGDSDASLLLSVLVTDSEEIRMPQEQPPLAIEEIEVLRRWIADGANAFPKDVQQPEAEVREETFSNVVGVEYVLKQILAHQRKQSSQDRRFIRYFSANHLLTRGATRQELDIQYDAVAKTVNHLTYEREPAKVSIIDGETASVFAVDIRDLGWHADHVSASTHSNAMKGSLDGFDLLLLEYPYAIGYQDSEIYERLLTEFIRPSKMVRDVPFVRSDWFCSMSLQPELYHDIMKLPHTVQELEQHIVGVNAEKDLHDERVARGAVILSGVSRNNRAAERYRSRHGAYWKSIDYATNKGQENIFLNPIELHGVGGEMIFNLPNGLQGYYLADGIGNRLDAGPTEIVTDKFAEDKVVRNALSCVRCHDRGIKTYRDVVRPAVETLPGNLGFSKRKVLALYPKRDEFTALLKKDGARFMDAMEKVLGHPQETEPLTPVTRHFLEDPLTLGTAAGELGLAHSADLAVVFRSRSFAALGLVPLASKGAIRRDTWEDHFDQVVRELGLGEPIVPLDGNMRLDYAPLGHGPDIGITTTRGSRFFAPGDEIAIILTNNGKQPVFIELVGTGTKGEKVVLLPAETVMNPGHQLSFPEQGTITVKPSTGRELITVFASHQRFPAGTLYRADDVADRYVHELPGPKDEPIVKKSLVIQTR
ncbi:MAG: c-type cytochrome domain-containing protein [Fuerstiella sp.]